MRLVGFAADEIGVFVRLEIAQPQDDVLRIEGGGDHRDALRQLVDEELRLVRVAGGEPLDLRLGAPDRRACRKSSSASG